MAETTRAGFLAGTAAVAILLLGAASAAAAAAPVLTTLVAFSGSNGSVPVAGLTLDPAGNLYGSTVFGGTGGGQFGYGIVFALSGAAHSSFTTLATFTSSNGSGPAATLTQDAAGNLYGTASGGGPAGDGTAFRLSGPQHRHLTTLISFAGSNGSVPLGGLTLLPSRLAHAPGSVAVAGNVFGTTSTGGASGDGTVFELSGAARRHLTTLVSFSVANGSRPGSTLVADAAGHLYGTTFTGGAGTYGTVFELSGPDHHTLTTLAEFNGAANGANPVGGLTLDKAGNLFGTTQYGGPGGGGTIFELAGPDHRNLVTLASFGANDPNGAVPQGTLLIDAAGNLYGTTNGGADQFGGAFLGAVFKLSADHQTMTPLYAFTGGLDGDIPQAGLVADAAGNLYGTTTSGGAGGAGTVFELSGTGFVTSASRVSQPAKK